MTVLTLCVVRLTAWHMRRWTRPDVRGYLLHQRCPQRNPQNARPLCCSARSCGTSTTTRAMTTQAPLGLMTRLRRRPQSAPPLPPARLYRRSAHVSPRQRAPGVRVRSRRTGARVPWCMRRRSCHALLPTRHKYMRGRSAAPVQRPWPSPARLRHTKMFAVLRTSRRGVFLICAQNATSRLLKLPSAVLMQHVCLMCKHKLRSKRR